MYPCSGKGIEREHGKEIEITLLRNLQLVRKPVNANPEEKVNRSYMLIFLDKNVFQLCWCSLKLFRLKTAGQTIQAENLTENLQN